MNLTCKATLASYIDVEALEITWDGPSNSVYRIMETNSSSMYSSSLYIQNLEETDKGEYVCTFQAPSIGTFLNGSISVDVQGKKFKVSK